MFDKLKSLFENHPEKEFKPRQQGLRNKIAAPISIESMAPGEQSTQDDRGVSIGADPFNRKTEIGKEERIQSKLELLKQLQKELGNHG